MKPSEMEHALGSCEFFKLLGKSEISEIAKLYYGEHIYVIAQGRIHLERSVDLGAQKGNVVIETLGRGRVLGCWSTLLNMPHILMSSAVCQKLTHIVTLRGADLRKMMIGNTELGFNIMERLCYLLRDRLQAAYGAMEKI